MKMKTILFLSILLYVGLVRSEEHAPQWRMIGSSNASETKMESTSAQGFSLEIRRTSDEGKVNSQVCLTVDKDVSADDCFVFACAVEETVPCEISFVASLKNEDDVSAKFGKKIKLKKMDSHTYFFRLADAFGIQQKAIRLWQLKVGVQLLSDKLQAANAITFSDIKIVTPEEMKSITAEILFEQTPSVTKENSAWNMIVPGEGATYSLNSVSQQEFLVSLKRNEEEAPAAVQICTNIDKVMHSQSHLMFTCRGYNDNPVTMQILLSYMDGKKSVMRFGPRFTIKGNVWHDYDLPLDVNFRLGDGDFHLWQLKFAVNITGAKAGASAGMEMRNIQICLPGEAGVSSGRADVIVQPQTRKTIEKVSNPLKIFCQFDNEDDGTVFSGRSKYGEIRDSNPYRGYRWVLFSSVESLVELVLSPEEADVIVYSGARPSPEIAKRIAGCVNNGTPLIAASAIADPEIAALLPVTLAKMPDNDFPPRQTCKPVGKSNELFAGLNSAKFGIYFNTALKPGAEALLSFADNRPAIAQSISGKGAVLYSSFAFGVELIQGTNAHDAFLLRAISHLTGRALPIKVATTVKADHGWYDGAGTENFGRFGYMIGDGLTVGKMNNRFDVINGSQEYSFHFAQTPKMTLSTWHFKPIGEAADEHEREISWNCMWSRIGVTELSTKVVIPEEWKGKKIVFAAEGGIDDTAEVYFNGTMIGQVTTEMPEYWMRPHRYRLPEQLITYNGMNEIRILTENIRGSGGFGACPELIAVAGKNEPWVFVPDRANWIGKGGVVTESQGGKRRFDTSLAFPGVRWDVSSEMITMSLHNIADYAAYKTAQGIRIIQLTDAGELPTDWTEPWLLFFRDGVERPLLLVFGKRPNQLSVKKTGNIIDGIQIQREGSIGMLLPLWICGSVSIDSRNWKNSLPNELQNEIAFWYPKAFSFPVAATEQFKLDEQNQKVLIKTCYQYLKTHGDWNIEVADYAPVSPLAYFSKGLLFESDEVSGCGMITQFGEYAFQDKTDTAEWSLPLPVQDCPMIPQIMGFDKITDAGNELFRFGVNFSAGGGAKLTDWTPAYPCGKGYAGKNLEICKNINMHGWLHGLNYIFNSPYCLNEENWTALKQRIYRRLFEPVEIYRYKSAQRWREEPYSGIRYPVYFNNPHPLNVNFTEGAGSSINYADANETAHMILSLMQLLADFHGQSDFIRANGNFIRQVARLLLVSDDWEYMACHCRESGQSATIDMLNAEYSSMMKLARLAEILQDDSLRAQALYRASRRLVPTVMRMPFLDYAAKSGLIAYGQNAVVGIGFTEDGISYRAKGYTPIEVDLYDMSQGIPQEIISLYSKYVPDYEMRYFRDIVFPTMFNQDGNCRLRSSMLNIVARASKIDHSSLQRLIDSYLSNERVLKKKRGDWIGMCDSGDFSQVIYRLSGSPVKIKTAKEITLIDFVYNPEDGNVVLDLVAGENSVLVMQSALTALGDVKQSADGSFAIKLIRNERQKITVRLKRKLLSSQASVARVQFTRAAGGGVNPVPGVGCNATRDLVCFQNTVLRFRVIYDSHCHMDCCCFCSF